MKKILLICFLSFAITAGFAQTDKGDWMIGGGLQLNTSKSKTTFILNPNIGWFIMNDLALGAQMFYSYVKLGDQRTNSFGAGPYARYYFLKKNVRPFAHADFDFETGRVKLSSGESTENAFNFFLGAGVAFFINQNVAVETLAGYKHTNVKNESGNGGFAFKLGFQVYINRNQAEQARSTIQGN